MYVYLNFAAKYVVKSMNINVNMLEISFNVLIHYNSCTNGAEKYIKIHAFFNSVDRLFCIIYILT